MTVIRYRVDLQRAAKNKPAISHETEDGTIFGWSEEVWFGPDFEVGIVQKDGRVYVEKDSGAPDTVKGWEAT